MGPEFPCQCQGEETNSLKIRPGAKVGENVDFRGYVTIDFDCIINSNSSIIADSGPIILGQNCIVGEGVTIINRLPDDVRHLISEDVRPVLHIGSNNIFERGCKVQAYKIGNNNIFKTRCVIGPKVQIMNNCIIGPGCQITGETTISDNSVIN